MSSSLYRKVAAVRYNESGEIERNERENKHRKTVEVRWREKADGIVWSSKKSVKKRHENKKRKRRSHQTKERWIKIVRDRKTVKGEKTLGQRR